MGYDNNNAGMHMVWWRSHHGFDEGYINPKDEYVLDSGHDDCLTTTCKKANNKGNNIKGNEGTSIKDAQILTSDNNKLYKSDHSHEEQEKVKTERRQPKKEHRHKKEEDIEEKVYGNQDLVDEETYAFSDVVMANIMIEAIARKKDISAIFKECNLIMHNDSHMNPKLRDMLLDPISRSDKSVIFFSLLASKIGCRVIDLFDDNPEYRKKFVYDLLKKINIDEVERYNECDYGEIYSNGNAVFSIENFDILFGLAEPHSLSPNEFFKKDMDLRFLKAKTKNGTYVYDLSFGQQYLCKLLNQNDYCYPIADLWFEEKGELADFIEGRISAHPEWLANSEE